MFGIRVVGMPSCAPRMSRQRLSRQRDWAKSIGGRLIGFGVVASALWAGFWGLVAWNVFTDNIGAGAVIGGIASAIAALLPAAMLYMRRRPSTPERPQTKPEIKLPAVVRPSYRRLMTAHEQAKNLVAEGIIDESVLEGIEERIDEVIRLLSADITNQELGGHPSAPLRDQVDELTDLLVGLVDAALDRRTAALDSDDQAAAALREALGRMRAEERGYREIGELDDNR
jgi:uncharacterized membrane protein